MNVLWYKLRDDLWNHKARTLLAAASIAAGVFSVGAIFGMVDQMLAGMDAAHREVAPSHVNIILRNLASRELVEELRSVPGVQSIDPVNQITVRYKLDADGKWVLGTLVQRDYAKQVHDLVSLREGTWPASGSFAIERLSAVHWNVANGAKVIFDVKGTEEARRIDGRIRHPFVQPPRFGGQAHFFTDAEGLEKFGIPAGMYGQLLLRVDDYSLERSKEVAAAVRAALGRNGVGVAVTLYQDPDKHWGRMFVEGINAVMQIMAVVALLLSVILVLNTMTALITQQMDQIGIIKSVGGRSGSIIRVYLAEVLVLGALAFAVAVPAGALFAHFMTAWFLALFNIDTGAISISGQALALQASAALVAPLLAALPPVLRGARMTVREAIATYGIGGDFGNSVVDRAVERLASRFFSSLFAVALGNMFRRKGRLMLTVLVLVTAGVMFLVVMTLVSSTNLTLDNELARRDFAVRIGLAASQPASTVLPLVREEQGVSDAEMWLSRNATLLRSGERLEDSAGLGAQLLGLPAATTMYRPVIVSGRWFRAGDAGRLVVLSQETAEKNGLKPGDAVTLDLGGQGESAWEVLGTYRVVYGGGFAVEPIYAPLPAVEKATGANGAGTQIFVRASGADTIAAANALAERLEDRLRDRDIGIDVYTSLVPLKEREYVNNQFDSVISTLLGLAMIAATVGAIGLTGALAISVVERTREIGVMRSLGAKSGVISRLYLMEGILQGLLSWVLAVPVAYVVSQPVARLLGQRMLKLDLDYAFATPAVFIWLSIVLTFAVSAALWPARMAARARVRENLSYQ
jgi:putative ABC transport system permease protein